MQPIRSVLFAFITLSICPPVSGQGLDSDFEGAVLDRAPTDHRSARVHHVDHGPGLWSRGPDYKVHFGAEAMTFYPFLGADAERHSPFICQTVSIVQDGNEASSSQGEMPKRIGEDVLYHHGNWQEGYSLSPEGVEQWFVLDSPLGEGDLTVRIGLGQATDWTVTRRNGGLRFENERGGVDYGAATVLDARGREVGARLAYEEGVIEIHVPSDFLDQAVWPIKIDPLISTFVVDDFGTFLYRPDVAYDVTSDSFLVVYEERFTTDDRDVYFHQFEEGTLTVLSEGYLSVNTDDWSRPRVANNNFANLFLIAFEIDFGSYTNVGFRTVDAVGGSLGPILGVDPTEFVSNHSIDVGGEVFDGSASYFLAAWVQEDLMGNSQVLCTRIGSDGIALFEETELDSLGPSQRFEPSVANTAGAAGIFNVAWGRHEGNSNFIRGAQVSYAGSILEPDFPVATASSWTASNQSLSVSPPLDVGDVGNYIVTFKDNSDAGPWGWSPATRVVSMNGRNTLDSTWMHQDWDSWENHFARSDSDGERFIVTVSGSVSSTAPHVLVSTFSSSGGFLCQSEVRTRMEVPGGAWNYSPSVSTKYSGGGERGKAHLVWVHTPEFNSNVDIWHGRFDMNAPDCIGRIGICFPRRNSTGFSARLWGYGSRTASDQMVRLYADRMPLNQFGYFITGTGSADILPAGSDGHFCLGGSIGRFNRTPTEILFTGNSGSFQLDIDTQDMPTFPSQAILAGSRWNFQGWHRDLNPTSTSNFTTLLEVDFN